MTTKTGIIYLQRDKFQVYSPYLPSILEFRFVPELIRDYDLINKTLFENLLKVFLGNNKIPPSSMVIVVSDSASFMKDFVSPPQPITPNPQQQQTPPPTLEDLKNAANEYLEHVPFEDVASKVFPLATGVRAYATNQEIYVERPAQTGEQDGRNGTGRLLAQLDGLPDAALLDHLADLREDALGSAPRRPQRVPFREDDTEREQRAQHERVHEPPAVVEHVQQGVFVGGFFQATLQGTGDARSPDACNY